MVRAVFCSRSLRRTATPWKGRTAHLVRLDPFESHSYLAKRLFVAEEAVESQAKHKMGKPSGTEGDRDCLALPAHAELALQEGYPSFFVRVFSTKKLPNTRVYHAATPIKTGCFPFLCLWEKCGRLRKIIRKVCIKMRSVRYNEVRHTYR